MPLPPALLERLKKRKIIQVVPGAKEKEKEPPADRKEDGDEHEEILAEDYSDEDTDKDPADEEEEEEDHDDYDNTPGNESNQSDEDAFISDDEDEEQRVGQGVSEAGEESGQLGDRASGRDGQILGSRLPHESVIGCPNKYNIYHECVQYCVDNHGQPESLEPSLEQRKQLALVLRTFPMSNEWTVVYDPGVKTFYFWNIISNQVSWYPPGMSTFSSPSADQIRKLLFEQKDQ